MKTKLSIITALLGLFINAASAEEANLQGDMGLSYLSQNYFRGQSVSEEALQASIGADFDVAGLGAFVDFSTSQSLESGEDKHDTALGVKTSFLDDSLSVSVGLLHYEYTAGDAELEGFVGATYNTILSPTMRFYRNTEESLSTYEASVSHGFDLGLADLSLGAGIGMTDLTSTTDSDYYELSAVASRSITDSVEAFARLAYNDADNRDDADAFGGIGFLVKF
jgi:hypothetical protein|tara:strand:- start:2761 stop:3429 length:669 start_codon:yes stop_codon:yes gene_type:complete